MKMRKIFALLSSILFLILIFTIPNIKAETYTVGQKYKHGEFMYELKRIINPNEFMNILTSTAASGTHEYQIFPHIEKDTKVYVTTSDLNSAVEATIEEEYVSAPETGLPGTTIQKLEFTYYEIGRASCRERV